MGEAEHGPERQRRQDRQDGTLGLLWSASPNRARGSARRSWRRARVEGEVGGELDQFPAGHAVGQGAAGVAGRFGVAVAGGGRRHGDQAAVALGQAGALPHLAEQHAVGETGQRGCDVATRPPREKDRVDSFARRHIGPNKEARDEMLSELVVSEMYLRDSCTALL